jgi:hypothetical protein
MHHTPASAEMTACIQACLDCYRHCQHTALTHCLEAGGAHVEPNHFRLMIDCAEACRAAAALMINESPYHAESCRLCALICRDCAESCRSIGDMDDCVRACEHCAESCEAMAVHAGKPRRESATSRAPARSQ